MPYDLMDKEISKLKLETNPSYYDGYTKAIVAKQNDINSRLLCVDIFASGERVDISKYSTKMNIKMPNNKHLATNGQLIDGNLYFRIYDSMLKEIGHISCDVSLYKECINVVADTNGSINYTDVEVEQDTFINKVGDLGSYIFEYNDTVWMLEDTVATLSDYGITLNENAELFSGDKIIISYSNYILLTTETFFIVVQENIGTEDADIPVDSNGKVFEYINADDVLIAIEQTHTHTNKDILDNTTAIYTIEDKTKLTNIDTNLYIEKSVMGKANGVATLDSSGLVHSAQLPSFVDDTIEGYTTSASAFSSDWLSLTNGGTALTPEKGKIYIVVSDGEYKNKQYRWGGTTYVLCNPSDVNSVNGKTGIVELILDDIPNGTNFVHTTNDFNNAYKTKLEGIEEGAQVNVNADWNAVEGEASFIKNKPLIPEGSKLYADVGTNTDGSIHQKGITDLLNAVNTNISTIVNENLTTINSEITAIKDSYVKKSGDTITGDLTVIGSTVLRTNSGASPLTLRSSASATCDINCIGYNNKDLGSIGVSDQQTVTYYHKDAYPTRRTLAFDDECMKLFGDQTIRGVKAFESRPTVNGTEIALTTDTPDLSGYVTSALAQREFGMLVPRGTYVPENSNLNTVTFMKVGNYYCSADVTVATLTNCPTSSAFMMQVLSPLSTTYDNESGAWVYRVRILTTYTGNVYYQNCSTNGSGTWSYGAWRKVLNSGGGAIDSQCTLTVNGTLTINGKLVV